MESIANAPAIAAPMGLTVCPENSRREAGPFFEAGICEVANSRTMPPMRVVLPMAATPIVSSRLRRITANTSAGMSS